MKMKCQKVKKLLSRTLDGEIEAGLKEKIHSHIDGCPECRKEFEELEALKKFLSSASVPEMSPYLLTRTIARLKEAKVLPISGWQVLVWRVVAVVLIVIGIGVGVLLGLGIGSNGEVNGELAALNSEPSIEELFAIGK
ncbi:MAG: zf-HC2 domain-containing protein [candidate division WOR-3 bacterium]